MKKLGIFGDSYADEIPLYTHKSPNNVSWATMLAEKLRNEYVITNHAVCGSSIDYTFVEYDTKKSTYDKKIILLTGATRAMLPEHSANLRLTGGHDLEFERRLVPHISPTNGVPGTSKEQILIDSKIEDYYKYIYNMKQDVYIYNNMKLPHFGRIQDKNTLIIACFDATLMPIHKWNAPGTIGPNVHAFFALRDIDRIDRRALLGDSNNFSPRDLRINHMNNYNCGVFANSVYGWIKTGVFDLNIDDCKPYSGDVSDIFEFN